MIKSKPWKQSTWSIWFQQKQEVSEQWSKKIRKPWTFYWKLNRKLLNLRMRMMSLCGLIGSFPKSSQWRNHNTSLWKNQRVSEIPPSRLTIKWQMSSISWKLTTNLQSFTRTRIIGPILSKTLRIRILLQMRTSTSDSSADTLKSHLALQSRGRLSWETCKKYSWTNRILTLETA